MKNLISTLTVLAMFAFTTQIQASAANVNSADFMFSAPVPVDLMSFEGRLEDRGIMLEWFTGSEENNRGFQIQKRLERTENWRDLAFIDGEGDSNNERGYRFEDRDIERGNVYEYRLIQMDRNGEKSVSDIVTVSTRESNTEFIIAPNPARDVTRIDLRNVEEGSVLEIRTQNGNLVMSRALYPGEQSIAVDVNGWIPGMYFVSVVSDSNVLTERLMIE